MSEEPQPIPSPRDPDLAAAVAKVLHRTPTNWDREEQLARVQEDFKNARPADRIVARMWVYQHDLVQAGQEYARAKTVHERLEAQVVLAKRAQGEKSAEVARMAAIKDSDDVFLSGLAYRAAEQRIGGDKEALRICHAQLDDLRTQAADQRAADSFTARDGI